MIKLYLDCDGVILDTIRTSSKMLKEEGIHGEPAVRKFYSNIDWNKLIEDSGEINYSISKIKELIKYFDVEILTHVNSDKESKVKIEYFTKELPSIKVTTVPKQIMKADFVDPTNCILVDDYTLNLDYWQEKGGIAVKFSESHLSYNYPVINDLLELIKIFDRGKIKVKE